MIHVIVDMNHDIRESAFMTDDEPTLADKRAQVTHDAIIAATQQLLITEHPATLSVPAVAKLAGVSVRTVYRYFPNKQALLDGIAQHFPNRAMGPGPRRFDDLDAMESVLVRMWTDFSHHAAAVRAEHLSPVGDDLRQRRLQDTRAGVAKTVNVLFETAPEDERERLTDLLVAVCSSSMFLELTDRMGRGPEESARMAMWTARSMLAAFSVDQAVGNSTTPERTET